MKKLKLILALAMAISTTAGALRAQEANSFVAVHPYIVSNRDMVREGAKTSRFWTRSTIALVALDGAAKAADSFATRENIDNGGVEYNPLARPLVRTAGAQVATMGALFGAEIATAYLLHRARHTMMERGVLAGGAVMNGLGAASSFRHRVGW
jgi:hypothetical protein